jgi:hypothetical protein
MKKTTICSLVVAMVLLGATLRIAPAEAKALNLIGWGGFLYKLDSYGRYSETLTKDYVPRIVPELASKGYNLIRSESRPYWRARNSSTRIHYTVLDLLISKAQSYGITVVIDPSARFSMNVGKLFSWTILFS